MTWIKWGFLVTAIVFLAKTLQDQWPQVQATLQSIPAWSLMASVVMAGCVVIASGAQQRAILREMGHPIRRRRWYSVFLLAQLGKYLPGVAWAYVAQIEMSRDEGVRRSTSLVVILLGAGYTVVISFALGLLLVGEGVLTEIPTIVRLGIPGLALAASVSVVVWPNLPVRVLRLVSDRVPRLQTKGIVLRSSLRPVALSLVAMLFYGLHLWALLIPQGSTDVGDALRSTGAFAVAWACGFLFVFAPAGLGIREAVLVALLAGWVPGGAALATAVLSRFLIIVAEAGLALSVPVLRHFNERKPES